MKKEYAAINLAEILLHFFLTFQLIFLVKNSVKKENRKRWYCSLSRISSMFHDQ